MSADIQERLTKPFAIDRFQDGVDDSWIESNSSECPIPWAKAGEFEMLDNYGKPTIWNRINAVNLAWCQGCKYRLTDWWVPIFNGKCPNAARGWPISQVAFKAESGEIRMDLRSHLLGDSPIAGDIVAVRLLLADDWIPVNSDGSVPLHISSAGSYKWEYRSFPASSYDLGDHGCDDTFVAVRLIKNDMVKIATPHKDKDAALDDNIETTQQRLNREAYRAYKAKHPEPIPFRSLGEGGIEDAIFNALCESLKK